MFENINNFFKKLFKIESPKEDNSGKEAKERLHLVLMQDRANVSADFLEMMKQEIIEVIKKYIDVDENQIDVRLTNQENDDGSKGAPALYANIPIVNIKEENQKTLNNVGVGDSIGQNQTQPSNEDMSSKVDVDVLDNTSELKSSNENTSNNIENNNQNIIQTQNENNSNNIDSSNSEQSTKQSEENILNDIQTNSNDDLNQIQSSNGNTSNNNPNQNMQN